MIERLPYSDDPQYNPRVELDNDLEVDSWTVPGVPPLPVIEEGPAWWRGDEDASQSFLASMGVTL